MRTARFNGHLYREASTQGVCVCVSREGGVCPVGVSKGGVCPGEVLAGGLVWPGMCVQGGVYPLGHRARHPLPHWMLGYTPTGGQEEWHALVKILPCPKLRLLVVKIKNAKICQGHETSYVSENSKRESNFLIEQLFSLTVSVSRKLPRASSGLKPGQFWFRRTSTQLSLGVFFSFYHKHSSLREGNVFSRVCLFVRGDLNLFKFVHLPFLPGLPPPNLFKPVRLCTPRPVGKRAVDPRLKGLLVS